MGDGIPAERSRTDFAGSSTRRLARRTSKRGRPEAAPNRVALDHGGTMPVAGLAPKPPPVLVLYEDASDELAPAPVYGQYPRGLIAKLLPWLRCARHQILHVCSGSLPRGEGIRVDIRPEAQPDFLADGRHLPFADGEHHAVMLDPPYSAGYARSLYGVDYPRPSHLLREAARVTRPGGRIAIVHYITPKPVAGTRLIKAFGLSTGFDMPMRAVTIYERDHTLLLAVAASEPSVDHVRRDDGSCVSWCPACAEASA